MRRVADTVEDILGGACGPFGPNPHSGSECRAPSALRVAPIRWRSAVPVVVLIVFCLSGGAGQAADPEDSSFPIVNQGEEGTITLTGTTPQTTPQVGRLLTATLNDPDGDLSDITWKWEWSDTGGYRLFEWTTITTGVSSNGAQSSYRPGADDVRRYLLVSAIYTDVHGRGQGARTVPPLPPVQPAPVLRLELSDDLIDEDGGVSTVTAHLDKASSAETIVTVKVTPAGAVTLSGNRLTIAEGATESTITETVTITAKPDNVDELAFKVVTVSGSATNPDDITDPAPVTLVILLSEGEEGTIALTGTPPQVGRLLTATLSDPDGGLSNITWKWEWSTDQSDWMAFTTGVLSNGTMSSYTPGTADINQYLRVSATYTDNVGGASATSEPVQVLPLPTVSLELSPDEIAESDMGGMENRTTVRAILSLISDADTTVTLTEAPEYTLSGRTLEITAGNLTSSGSVTLTAENNDVHGPASKTVTVSGSATNTDGVTGPASVELTITDDDEPPAGDSTGPDPD